MHSCTKWGGPQQKIELLRVTGQWEENSLIGEDRGLSHIDGITPHTERIDATIQMALACSKDAPTSTTSLQSALWPATPWPTLCWRPKKHNKVLTGTMKHVWGDLKMSVQLSPSSLTELETTCRDAQRTEHPQIQLFKACSINAQKTGGSGYWPAKMMFNTHFIFLYTHTHTRKINTYIVYRTCVCVLDFESDLRINWETSALYLYIYVRVRVYVHVCVHTHTDTHIWAVLTFRLTPSLVVIGVLMNMKMSESLNLQSVRKRVLDAVVCQRICLRPAETRREAVQHEGCDIRTVR